MSPIVILMGVWLLVSQQTWPSGPVLLLTIIALVPAAIVDLLVLVGPAGSRGDPLSRYRADPANRRSDPGQGPGLRSHQDD
jgi:hypothetical protein